MLEKFEQSKREEIKKIKDDLISKRNQEIQEVIRKLGEETHGSQKA